MIDDELEARLRSADGDLARGAGRAPRVADLERRHRRVQVKRAGVLALLCGAAATAHWNSVLMRGGDDAPGAPFAATPALASLEPSLESLRASLADLDCALASLRAERARPAPTPSIDRASLAGFRALRPTASAGDSTSLRGIRSIAESLPDTPGGRVARVFLDRRAESRPTDSLSVESPPKGPEVR